MAHQRPRPQLILCSSATRARQTCEAIAPDVGPAVDVFVEGALYGATAGELLARLHQLPEHLDTILVVGHNPGLQDLAVSLAGDGDGASLSRVRERFPTGALATLSAAGSWAGMEVGQAYLEAVVVPRDLPG